MLATHRALAARVVAQVDGPGKYKARIKEGMKFESLLLPVGSTGNALIEQGHRCQRHETIV